MDNVGHAVSKNLSRGMRYVDVSNIAQVTECYVAAGKKVHVSGRFGKAVVRSTVNLLQLKYNYRKIVYIDLLVSARGMRVEPS